MSNQKNNFSSDEIEDGNSLIKESSELQVQSLYQILIKNPYLVNAVDNKKETILSYSLKNNNLEISNLILTSPIIDLDYQDKEGNTYLHLAVLSQQEEIIKLLIEKGIYINKQNKEGNTALHLAYMINDSSIIKILLENGIDINILNKENKSAEKIKNKKLNCNNNISNKIKVSKKKELNTKKENKLFLEKNLNVNMGKKNNAIANSNAYRNRKENYLNKNSNGNNNKSITSSKSGNKRKIKTNQNQEIIKNNKINGINYNNDTVKTYNDTNIKGFKNNHHYNEVNEKYSEFDRTINIDWDITKNNINKDKEKEDEKFINYKYNEKRNSLGREQDLCNIEDNNSTYNDNFSEKDFKKLKVNKKIYITNNNTNNKKSSKQKIIDKGKNLIKNNNNISNSNSNNSKNNCLLNSTGYNPCSSAEFSIKPEKRHSKNSSNIFTSKNDISQTQSSNQVNQYNDKTITIHNNDNFIDFNDCQEKNSINTFHALSGNFKKKQNIINDMNINTNINNPKRKTEISKTTNKNILISNKIKNNKENNLNIKSSNMESSLITQSRLKSSHKKNNPLIEFLSQINLLKYLNNLDNNGFDDINLLIEEAKKGDIIKDQELKETGIKIPGDRAKILIRIKEKANLFGFTVPKSVYYTLKNFNDIECDQHIIDLNNWLSNLKVDRYLMNFINNGYHSIELLLMQMETENPLTTEILRDEIGIDKIGYRSRILNKLKEEARSLSNKLKTSILVVNNRGDDKNCECIIF